MSRNFSILMICALLWSAACQTQNQASNNNQTVNSVAGKPANTAAKEMPVAPENSTNADAQTITIDAPDGVKLVGTFYATNRANAPAVLMLHQFGSNRQSYQDLAAQFQKNGIAVLAIDGRGFGESTKKDDGSKVSAGQSAEAVAGMKSDAAAAVRFLSEQKSIDKARIGIIGASYGSSLAVIYAGEDSSIKAVALLSPGTNYFGNLPTIPAIEKYAARPVLIVAAEDDAESAAASRELDRLAVGDKHQLQIYPKGGHGTGILTAGVGLDKLLLDFFQKNL